MQREIFNNRFSTTFHSEDHLADPKLKKPVVVFQGRKRYAEAEEEE